MPSRLKLASFKCTLYDPRFTSEERSFGLLWAAKSGELEGVALALHHDQQLLTAGVELVHSGTPAVPSERSNAGDGAPKSAAACHTSTDGQPDSPTRYRRGMTTTQYRRDGSDT